MSNCLPKTAIATEYKSFLQRSTIWRAKNKNTHRTCVQKPRRGEERGERLAPSFEASWLITPRGRCRGSGYPVQDLGIFNPKFLRERHKSFVHRVFSIRSITPGHDKVLAFILGLKLAPTSNGRAKVAATREVYYFSPTRGKDHILVLKHRKQSHLWFCTLGMVPCVGLPPCQPASACSRSAGSICKPVATRCA